MATIRFFKVLALVIGIAWVFPSWAANCYGLVARGESWFATEKYNQKDRRTYQLFDQEFTLNQEVSTSGRSTVTQVGVGCRLWPYLGVEVAYWRGFSALAQYSAQVKFNDRELLAGDATYIATAELYGLVLLPSIQVNRELRFTVPLGAGRATVLEVISSSHFPDGMAIRVRERNKTVPILGIGLDWQPSFAGFARTDVIFRLYGVNYRKFTLTTIGVRYWF